MINYLHNDDYLVSLFSVAIAICIGLFMMKAVKPFIQILTTYLIVKRFRSKRHLLKEAGDWAIVTGGSDGIGKGFAMELASEGLNILLLSNDSCGLEKTCREIEERFSVKTAKIEVEFTEVDAYDEIREAIDRLPSIACLVNNVGMLRFSGDLVNGEDPIDWKALIDPIKCNCIPIACITRIVLRKMLRQTTPGRTIINISSYAADHSSPFMLIYGATKAFDLQFSNCLAAELAETGILVQAFKPHIVSTALSKVPPSWRIPNANAYAKSALDMLGVERNSCGYLMHAVYSSMLDLLPSEYIWRFKHKVLGSLIAKDAQANNISKKNM